MLYENCTRKPWYHQASLGSSALCCPCHSAPFGTLLHSCILALSPCIFPAFRFSLYLLELQRLQTQEQCNRLVSPPCWLEHQNFPSQFQKNHMCVSVQPTHVMSSAGTISSSCQDMCAHNLWVNCESFLETSFIILNELFPALHGIFPYSWIKYLLPSTFHHCIS